MISLHPRRALVALLLLATAAFPHTGILDPVEQALDAVIAAHPGDETVAKAANKLLEAIALLGDGTPLATEMKVAAKVAKGVEKAFPAETDLVSALASASGDYRDAFGDARNRLAGAIALPNIAEKTKAGLQKVLDKIDKALASADASTTPSGRLKGLGKAAKYVAIAPGAPGETTATWVVNSLTVPANTVGVDLDGDGTPDNNLGTLLAPLGFGAILNDAITGGSTVILLQMWWINSFAADPLIAEGVVNGEDTDGNTADNFTGSETFTVAAGLDADGHPTVRTGGSLTAGRYAVVLDAATITLPGLTLPPGTELHIQATASPTANDGLIGFPVPASFVIALIDAVAATLPPEQAALAALAKALVPTLTDLDTDGDGTPDAISSALEFTSVPAGIATP